MRMKKRRLLALILALLMGLSCFSAVFASEAEPGDAVGNESVEGSVETSGTDDGSGKVLADSTEGSDLPDQTGSGGTEDEDKLSKEADPGEGTEGEPEENPEDMPNTRTGTGAQTKNATGVVKTYGITKQDLIWQYVYAIVIEYEEDVVEPDAGVGAFLVTDNYMKHLGNLPFKRDDPEEAIIGAVYVNDKPAMREDQSSVGGRYLIVELEHPKDFTWNDKLGSYAYENAAGVTCGRLDKKSWWELRRDFSELVVEQKVDIEFMGSDTVSQAGMIPTIQYEDLINLENDEFAFRTLRSPSGGYDFHYAVYLPEDYDPDKTYPMAVYVMGNGGRLSYEQKVGRDDYLGLGANLTGAGVAQTWMDAPEDMIILAPQPWATDVPAGWGVTDVTAADDTAYLVNYYIENYGADPERVYAVGSSYGTMHLSRVMYRHPGIFAAYIQLNGVFNGASGGINKFAAPYNRPLSGYTETELLALGDEARLSPKDYLAGARRDLAGVVDYQTPIWIWHGVNDESISSTYALSTYEVLRELYAEQGLSEAEIDALVRITLIEDEEMFELGITSMHDACKYAIATGTDKIQAWALAQTRNSVAKAVGITRMYDHGHFVEAIAIRYDENIVAPGIDDFLVTDDFLKDINDVHLKRDNTETAIIAAVYTNSEPAVRADRESVEGRWLIVELDHTPNFHFNQNAGKNGAYVYDNAAAPATYRITEPESTGGTFRRDFTDLVVNQKMDVRNAAGEVVFEAGILPTIRYDELIDLELDQFEQLTLPSPNGNHDIHYSLRLPADYDSSREYPVLVYVTGTGGRIDARLRGDEGEYLCIGNNLARERGAQPWLAEEDLIIIAPQVWDSTTVTDWEYSDATAVLDIAYLIDYYIENEAVDAGRVYGVGSSYGAIYLSGLIGQRPDLLAAFVQFNGYFSGAQKYPTGFTPLSGKTAEDLWAMERLEDYSRAISILSPVAENRIPVWVLHGVNDETLASTYGATVYEVLVELYTKQGLSKAAIDELIKITLYEDEEFYKVGLFTKHDAVKLCAANADHDALRAWTMRQGVTAPATRPSVSRGSGNGGSSGWTASNAAFAAALTTATSANVNSDGSVNQSVVVSEAGTALAAALDGGDAVVRTQNATSVSAATLKALADAASSAGKSLMLHADTMNGASVQGRLYVDPSAVAGDLQLGVYTDVGQIAAVKNLFESWFGNRIAVVKFDQQGELGARLQAAVKLDLSGMDTDNLVFYSYDSATNSFRAIEQPEYRIDANGYLHFHTAQGGYVVVSEGALARK